MVFSQLNSGNTKKGQFFTPYHLSQFMAKISIGDIEKQLEERDFVTLSEPCCGSGGIIIAFCETLKENDYNYQNQLYVEAIDIDELCFMMTYIQLTLFGVSAKVILGDTIALNFQQVLYTPMYFMNGFCWKLKRNKTFENNQNEEFEKLNQIQQAQQMSMLDKLFA